MDDKFNLCPVQLAIREWDNTLNHELEFRCFVYNDKLNAISQYNPHCYYFEYCHNEKFLSCIKLKIIQFWNEIKSNIPYNHYIIDIGIIMDK